MITVYITKKNEGCELTLQWDISGEHVQSAYDHPRGSEIGSMLGRTRCHASELHDLLTLTALVDDVTAVGLMPLRPVDAKWLDYWQKPQHSGAVILNPAYIDARNEHYLRVISDYGPCDRTQVIRKGGSPSWEGRAQWREFVVPDGMRVSAKTDEEQAEERKRFHERIAAQEALRSKASTP